MSIIFNYYIEGKYCGGEEFHETFQSSREMNEAVIEIVEAHKEYMKGDDAMCRQYASTVVEPTGLQLIKEVA